ncbi:MAG: WbqC family protein [Thermoanaerobaculia bacterium]
MRLAVTQPAYLPWLGYFDLLDRADHWVSFDTPDLSSGGFTRRNRIRLRDGRRRWLTVPIEGRSRSTPIHRAHLANGPWWESHVNVIAANYSRAPHWEELGTWLRDLLRPRSDETVLSRFNERVVIELAAYLGIAVELHRASDLRENADAAASAQEKILSLCRSFPEAEEYLNAAGGVAAGLYDPRAFSAAGLALTVQEYDHPVYPQGEGPFTPYLSVVDCILWNGTDTLGILRSGSGWRTLGRPPER